MDKSTHMQACISTNKSVAFNIHPKQHYAMENQWIRRDEEKTAYIPGSSSQKENKSQPSQPSFPLLFRSKKPHLLSSLFFNGTASFRFTPLSPFSHPRKNIFLSQKISFFQKNKYLPLFRICSPFSLSSPRSLLQPPFFLTHSFCSPLFLQLPAKSIFYVLKSYCNFKKRGWFLAATKDVTRGLLG